MTTGRWTTMGWGVALAALGMMTTAPGVRAQDADRDCRCVDSDGNPIENCSCFVIPEMPRAMAFGNGDFDFAFPSPPNRPRLGITVNGDQDDALDAQGARVTQVMEDGPAEDAGLREGDIITSVDGQSLLEPLDSEVEDDFDLDRSIPVQRLLAIASRLDPGSTVEVGYVRDGQPRTTDVDVQDLGAAWGAWARNFRDELRPQMDQLREQLREQRQTTERQRQNIDRQREQVDRQREQMRILGLNGDRPFVVGRTMERYGVRFEQLTDGMADYFGVDGGVLVTDVDDDSTLGLQAGDIVLRIGDREVDSPDRLRRVLATYDADEQVSLRVSRRGSEIDVLGRLGN